VAGGLGGTPVPQHGGGSAVETGVRGQFSTRNNHEKKRKTSSVSVPPPSGHDYVGGGGAGSEGRFPYSGSERKKRSLHGPLAGTTGDANI